MAESLVNTWELPGTRLYANWLSRDQAQEAIRCVTRRWRSTAAIRPTRTRAVAVPIYQTIAHEFDDAAHAGAVFDLEMPGFHYNRLNNPTNDVLEHRIAALENGTGAVVLSSGAAAVNYSILNLATVERQHRHRTAAVRVHLHLVRLRAAGSGHRGAFRRGRPPRGDRAR